jgi:hypothetical protein
MRNGSRASLLGGTPVLCCDLHNKSDLGYSVNAITTAIDIEFASGR